MRLLVMLALASSLPGMSMAGSPDPTPVPADLSVALLAEPNTNLEPGELVTFTLSVTNHGPEIVNVVSLRSSTFIEELHVHDLSTDCQNLDVAVGDFQGGYDYTLSWYLTLQGPLAVGETRSCHIQLSVGNLPEVFLFSFFVSPYFQDINPANDRATVYLRRGPAPEAAPIPTLSPTAACLLATLLASMAGFFAQRRRRLQRIPK
ncbi:MAG TPA: IPTL-CTERM sorting domain-containing protein [Rhodanobacteraceae bacterium]|nr:IPTL-CTERM sorting domain-containing protein [Rhodanobacteraceae bacterium]